MGLSQEIVHKWNMFGHFHTSAGEKFVNMASRLTKKVQSKYWVMFAA
jgi:hypothetical protein